MIKPYGNYEGVADDIFVREVVAVLPLGLELFVYPVFLFIIYLFIYLFIYLLITLREPLHRPYFTVGLRRKTPLNL